MVSKGRCTAEFREPIDPHRTRDPITPASWLKGISAGTTVDPIQAAASLEEIVAAAASDDDGHHERPAILAHGDLVVAIAPVDPDLPDRRDFPGKYDIAVLDHLQDACVVGRTADLDHVVAGGAADRQDAAGNRRREERAGFEPFNGE